MKRILTAIAVFISLIIVTVVWVNQFHEPLLTEPVSINKEKENFTVHIRVERNEEGFSVLRSLQYNGDKKVTLKHRTPLVSVSADKQETTFTGSPVNTDMSPGNIYHPQEARTFTSLDKGVHTLNIHAQFQVEDEIINIKTDKEIELH